MTPGDVVLTRMPAEAGKTGRLRPALVVAELPGVQPALLLCGISSRTEHAEPGWDIQLGAAHSEFAKSGLKVDSVVRPSWLVSVPATSDLPLLGRVSPTMLSQVRSRLAGRLRG